jgi:diadenosine tetraphosphatase ApaH/serine/threonine PP2A family protein phosphatase
MFCGHTHVPYVRTLSEGQFQVRIGQPNSDADRTRRFEAPLKRLINAGSVGEPRHGRTHATYVIYDADTQEVALREVSYDYQKTCAAIIEKGLPPIFAWNMPNELKIQPMYVNGDLWNIGQF